LYFRRLLDWQIGRLGTVEYLAGIDAGLSVHIKGVDAIAHQTANHRNVSALVNRRKPVTCRPCDQLSASHIEIGISGDQQRTGPALDDRSECRIDFTFRTRGDHIQLQPKSLRGDLRSCVDGLRRRAFRVYQNGNRAGTRHDLRQQFKALCVRLVLKLLSPVRLPPGRLRLPTRPAATGSTPLMNTIGIVDVAAFAANAAGRYAAAMTSTLRLT